MYGDGVDKIDLSYRLTKRLCRDVHNQKLHSQIVEVSLQINTIEFPTTIYLTKIQLGKLGKGKRITLCKTQLKKNGGFSPFLIPFLTTLATGALSSAAGWRAKKILDKTTESVLQLYYKAFFRTGKRRYNVAIPKLSD